LLTPGTAVDMWRQQALCGHCDLATPWNRDREQSEGQIHRHVRERHGIAAPQPNGDYRLIRERQCDYCLEPYLDDCTKCGRDYCRLHCGSVDGIHGYCGGCI
jgi:hypothetical protein